MEEDKNPPAPQPTLERILEWGFKFLTDCKGEKIYAKGCQRILYDSKTDKISISYAVKVRI